MQENNAPPQNFTYQGLADSAVRFGLAVFLVVMCARVIHPFVNLALWSVVLAIALYPVHKMIAARMGGRQGRAASVLVLTGLLLIGVPTVLLGGVHTSYQELEAGTLSLPPPKPSVAELPVVGDKLYNAWSAAASNLPQFVLDNKEALRSVSKRGLAAATSTAGSVMLFLASLIIAGIIMAYGESGSAAMREIIGRFAGEHRGPSLQTLITATVRSVATGVIGVAFIQALILGVGFLWAGIPAAGLLAIAVMVLGILQAPALLITLPVIAYLWAGVWMPPCR